jgi:hypothetical protein
MIQHTSNNFDRVKASTDIPINFVNVIPESTFERRLEMCDP